MAVIYWTQADGWGFPNTTAGEDDAGVWFSLTRTNTHVDTVARPAGWSGGYSPQNVWQISGLNLVNDKAQFAHTIKNAPKIASISAVFGLPAKATFASTERLMLFSIGNQFVYARESSGKIVVFLTGDSNALGTVDLDAYVETPLLFELDLDLNDGGTCEARVYSYATGSAGSLIDSASYAMPAGKNRTVDPTLVGGRVTNAAGALGNLYLSEYQMRDAAGSHVQNPYIGYPEGSTWPTDDFSSAGSLVASEEWSHYGKLAGTGTLVKSGGVLTCDTDGVDEACVLSSNPVIAQGHASIDISALAGNDRAGIVLARQRTDFNVSTGATDNVVPYAYYRVFVDENGGFPELGIELVEAGPPETATPLGSNVSISSGGAAGTLTVWFRESGVNYRIYAEFDNDTVFSHSSDDISIYPSQWGVWIERTQAGTQLDNFSLTWQYPSNYTVYELARFCDGSKGNALGHTAVIQSPKYNETVIVGYAGAGTEIDRTAKVWAWVVPLNGPQSEDDIVGPVELDVGDGAGADTYRAHNPSGATHDGRAVLLWGRDSYEEGGGQSAADVQDLCAAIHMGGRNFLYPDGSSAGDVGYDPRLTLASPLDDYRIHLKGQGFQRGNSIIMPGIRTWDGATLDHFMFTLTVPLSGTTFGTPTGGTPAGTESQDEWAIYPESDSAWWGWARVGATPAPRVYKSTDLGETWVLQTDAFPLTQTGQSPIDGSVLGGGEFVVNGPMYFDGGDGVAFRKQIVAIPLSSSGTYTQGWAFDRADEIPILWQWTKVGFRGAAYSAYGQVVSTTAGQMMASYTQRPTTAGGEEAAGQIFLIMAPQSVSGFSGWTNVYLGSALKSDHMRRTRTRIL
jgi:hypothetical protein